MNAIQFGLSFYSSSNCKCTCMLAYIIYIHNHNQQHNHTFTSTTSYARERIFRRSSCGGGGGMTWPNGFILSSSHDSHDVPSSCLSIYFSWWWWRWWDGIPSKFSFTFLPNSSRYQCARRRECLRFYCYYYSFPTHSTQTCALFPFSTQGDFPQDVM